MIIRVIDVETTGFPPDAAICEIGWTDLELDETRTWTKIHPTCSTLINPQRPIPPEASAVHHITDDDVANAPILGEVIEDLFEGPIVALAGHQVRFEQEFLKPPGARWICTWKNAIKLAPRAPGHSNQILRYWLKLNVDPILAHPPHRAGPDSHVTAHLLARMLRKISVDEGIAITEQPVVLPYFLFGKHAMQPMDEVPTSYFSWILRKATFDDDVMHTAFHYLQQRHAAETPPPTHDMAQFDHIHGGPSS